MSRPAGEFHDPAFVVPVQELMCKQSGPVFAYVPDGTIVHHNAEYASIFADRWPDGVIGKNVVDLEPEKADVLQQMIEANLARSPEDSDLVVESPSLNADGEMRWFEWRCVQAFDSDGNVELVLVIGSDQTPRRLEKLAAQRTAAALEERNRDLLDFAQVASHDLQEPLRKVTAFSGRLEAKLDGELDEQGVDYMRRMNSAVGRMQDLINDLLTFARVSTRGSEMVMTPLDEVIADVLTDLEFAIDSSGAKIEVGKLPKLPVDPTQMRQLFQNLIANAIKFRREGVQPEISISSEHILPTVFGGDEPPMGWYDIAVEDNGIGFDSQYGKKIFAPFQRLHGRSEFEGTGVGLSVCRRIAERHHGKIVGHGVPEKGSTFVVRLPTAHFAEEYLADAATVAQLRVADTIISDTRPLGKDTGAAA